MYKFEIRYNIGITTLCVINGLKSKRYNDDYNDKQNILYKNVGKDIYKKYI